MTLIKETIFRFVRGTAWFLSRSQLHHAGGICRVFMRASIMVDVPDVQDFYKIREINKSKHPIVTHRLLKSKDKY